MSGFFIESKAQESDFLIGDGANVEEDKSSEYLIPDSPFTDDKENVKKKEGEDKKIKEVQVPKAPEKATSVPLKETVQNGQEVKPIPDVSKPADTATEEENPLSFNFLYYIIHKFKFSDVADQ